jgi:hypothetical protein
MDQVHREFSGESIVLDLVGLHDHYPIWKPDALWPEKNQARRR